MTSTSRVQRLVAQQLAETTKPRKSRGASLMSRITQQIKSPHAQIAAAAGASILALAIASKWLVPRPIGYLSQAFPPFFAVIFETAYAKRPNSKLCTTWYWILAIVLATVLVIALHSFEAMQGDAP